jgi:alpha-beta hydrolase superfamily lysophospholipase
LTVDIEGARSRATPLWFGPEDRPLFGWVHLPADGMARGGVVLCQPLALEALCVYFSYRVLADQLASSGLAVVRFDYDGTGDSYGEETDPDRLDGWLGSVAAATDLLASTGVTSIGLVGIRMGGLFAAHEASRRGGVDVLALWDPCLSGKAFLREQRFLRHVSGDGSQRADDAVEAPGLRFEPETVKALSDLDITKMTGTLARMTVVLVPPDTSRPAGLERRLAGQPVEWQEATGEEALLDSQRQDPPYDTIRRLATWLSDSFDGRPVPVVTPGRPTASLGRAPGGEPIVERPVELGALGLFGIVTEGPDSPDRPAVVLVNEGGTHHIGQARMWVDLARRLAVDGFRVLRFDLSGNGDSGTRPGQRAHVARAPEAILDVTDAMAAISPDDPADVVLVGFCSGAYQVIEEALAAVPRGICVINPTFAFDPPEPDGTASRPARQTSKPWVVRAADPGLKWIARHRNPVEAERLTRAVHIGSWPAAVAVRHPGVPEWIWRVVNRVALDNPGISTLERIASTDTDTLLILGSADYVPIGLGAERRIRALEREPNFRLASLAELDHASWTMQQRHLMLAVIRDHVVATFAGPPPSPSSPDS